MGMWISFKNKCLFFFVKVCLCLEECVFICVCIYVWMELYKNYMFISQLHHHYSSEFTLINDSGYYSWRINYWCLQIYIFYISFLIYLQCLFSVTCFLFFLNFISLLLLFFSIATFFSIASFFSIDSFNYCFFYLLLGFSTNFSISCFLLFVFFPYYLFSLFFFLFLLPLLYSPLLLFFSIAPFLD